MKAKFEFVSRLNDEDWINGDPVTERGVIEMERYGKCGFLWHTEGQPSPGSTNEEGEGLWDGNQQVKGTMQYNLPKSPQKAIRKLVNQHALSRANAGLGQIKSLKITGRV